MEGQNGGMGLAIASMVLGIVALIGSCCFYYVSIPCGVISIILAAVSIGGNKEGKGMAIAGLVCSIVSLALVAITFILGGAILSELGMI